MTVGRIGYLLLCGSVLACSRPPVSLDESAATGNTTSTGTTVDPTSSEGVGESESGGTETSTETETGTDTDMDPSCVWEPAPPSDCIATDLPTTPFDPTGLVLDTATEPTLEIGPDGSVHVLATLLGIDDNNDSAGFFIYQTNASGMWTAEVWQSEPSFLLEQRSAISPSGVLHGIHGDHLRGVNGTFFSSGGIAGNHSLRDIAWSRNGEFGYMYGYMGPEYDLRAIWSSDDDCMTAEWVLPPCDYHRALIAMGPDDRLHVLQALPDEGFWLLTPDGDALSTQWLTSLTGNYSDFDLGDFVIDATGTMHACYGEKEQDGDPVTRHYVRFNEFGDWEELLLPELVQTVQGHGSEPACSLAVNDDGTVVWMTATNTGDRVARIEDGVATIIPTVAPFEGTLLLGDIALDELGQPVVAGTCWSDTDDTYFVMRRVADVWQLEGSFAI